MIHAIRAATNNVNMETFLWASGEMSDAFIDALTDRARAGITVRVVVDALGSRRLKDADVERMREAGVRFRQYNKPHLARLHRLNFRDHRKLLVVDGAVAFIGGACVADEWLGNAETSNQWRDTHFRVEGPIVRELQGVFASTWLKVEGELLFGERYYPALASRGDMLVEGFNNESGNERARLTYLSAIDAARRTIRLAHAYFVPDDLALEALRRACARGVSVEIIAPSVIDAGVVRRASRALWPELLRAGVRIYEYGPAMYHPKLLIVDDAFVSAGSVNFDERSFHINDESNINVVDAAFAAEVVREFERDRARSRRISEADLKRKPWYSRTAEAISSWFRGQL